MSDKTGVQVPTPELGKVHVLLGVHFYGASGEDEDRSVNEWGHERGGYLLTHEGGASFLRLTLIGSFLIQGYCGNLE